MTRHYSTRDFFRQMPNALLARYFHAHDLFHDLDFAALKEAQPDKLFAAWLELPDGQRNRMDAEFRDIFEMSCESGFRAILDEAEWHLKSGSQKYTEFVEKLAALADHCERAMITFLDHNRFWNGATLFHHADTRTYWQDTSSPASLAALILCPCRESELSTQFSYSNRRDRAIRIVLTFRIRGVYCSQNDTSIMLYAP